jgi:multimeric flavodoxin WrbA
MKVLGISGSLRNLRFGKGSDLLVSEIKKIATKDNLLEYLKEQGNLCLSLFIESGRKMGKPFNQLYEKLKKTGGNYGLSNSEIALATGLWGVNQNGVDIEHVSLTEFLERNQNKTVGREQILQRVQEADGILVSGPVYFGDRSSLIYDFLRLLKLEPQIVKNKVYAGIAVGAKRNGGQETTLIYQMMDFINIGMIAVGNDLNTTAQYGGTGVAGDVGTMANDSIGLETAIGTGNRIGDVVNLISTAGKLHLKDKPRIGVFILQDCEETALRKIKNVVEKYEIFNKADFKFFHLPKEKINRCIACDNCPAFIDDDEVYNCINQRKDDLFKKIHKEIIGLDGILLGGYSTNDFTKIYSVYQTFIERTRYLRRSDYQFSNLLVAPLVVEEVTSRENLSIRIITSMIRHHTIMFRPLVLQLKDGQEITENLFVADLCSYIELAGSITAGRILKYASKLVKKTYNPYGYTLRSSRDMEQSTIEKKQKVMENRKHRFEAMLEKRVEGHQ